MNSSRKLHEMMTSSKQAKKPWVSHHQRRRRFWALIMWLCSAGVQTIRMVPIRSILLRWTVWQTSTSWKRGNRTRRFMNLFVSSFAYFIEDYFFPSFNRFRCAFCTGNLGRVDSTTGRDDQDVLEQSFLGTRSEADCLYTTRASRLSGIEFFINGAPG